MSRLRLAAVGAPHSLQRAIERDELVALGRIAVEQALVNASVTRRIEQVNHGRLPVATGASAHLVELNAAKRHVIEHDMADIGQVHALTKGRGRNDATEASVTKRFLHAATIERASPAL